MWGIKELQDFFLQNYRAIFDENAEWSDVGATSKIAL